MLTPPHKSFLTYSQFLRQYFPEKKDIVLHGRTMFGFVEFVSPIKYLNYSILHDKGMSSLSGMVLVFKTLSGIIKLEGERNLLQETLKVIFLFFEFY